VRDKHVDLFASHEAELIPELSQLSGRDTQVAMTQWRMMAEALDDVDPPDLPRHEKHLSQTLDGRWEESGSYGAEGGAVIDAALRLVMDMQAEDEREWAAAQRRGNAMVDVCRFFLDNQSLSNPGRRNRPHLHVAIESISDDRVTGELAEQRLRDQAGSLLDYGTGSQTIPANLWRAIVARDRHCRYPGCDRPPTWCEGHHVQWFSRRGPTSKDNLVVLCSRHHHKLHVPGWDAKLRPDGELVITMPDGRTQSSRPPAPVGLRDLAKRSTAAA